MTAISTTTRGTETRLRAVARLRGLTMTELADKMGVTAGYLSRIAMGGRPWTPTMKEKAMAVLGEVPGQGIIYRSGSVVDGQSSYIRERARELGMSMRTLADRVGVSYGYMVQASRGRRNMSVKVQARVESALKARVKVAPEQCAGIDREAVRERMRAHGVSQNQMARQVGISSGHLSQIMNGNRIPSPGVLKRLHGVLFQRTQGERVVPVELKVLGWRKGERRGMVVRGAGGPGLGAKSDGDTVRTGGRMPERAKVEYAFRTGYDGMGRVSVEHVVQRGCSVLLTKPEAVVA